VSKPSDICALCSMNLWTPPPPLQCTYVTSYAASKLQRRKKQRWAKIHFNKPGFTYPSNKNIIIVDATLIYFKINTLHPTLPLYFSEMKMHLKNQSLVLKKYLKSVLHIFQNKHLYIPIKC